MFLVLLLTEYQPMNSEPSGDAAGGASTQPAGGEVGKVRPKVLPGQLPGISGVPGRLHHCRLLQEGRAGETDTITHVNLNVTFPFRCSSLMKSTLTSELENNQSNPIKIWA